MRHSVRRSQRSTESCGPCSKRLLQGIQTGVATFEDAHRQGDRAWAAPTSAHHVRQAGFDDGQLAEIGIVPGGDALDDRRGSARSRKGLVPAERVGAAVALSSLPRC